MFNVDEFEGWFTDIVRKIPQGHLVAPYESVMKLVKSVIHLGTVHIGE